MGAPMSMAEDLVNIPEWIRVAQDGNGPNGGFWTCAAATATSPKFIREDIVAAWLAAKDKEIERLRGETSYYEKTAIAHLKTVWPDDQDISGAESIYGLIGWMVKTQSRAEQAERVFTDLCEELGCKPDNEVALEAVAALKRALTEARETLGFYASEGNWSSPSTGFALQRDPEPSAIKKDWGAAARAFVAQHGSDSSTER